MKRRVFIQSGLFGLGLSLPVTAVYAREKIHQRTPTDFEGPFYPLDEYAVGDGNLILDDDLRRDDMLIFSGFIKDQYGDAVTNAVVDIWQTDPDGRYKHPHDRRSGDRREDFAYFAKTKSDDRGRFSFQTLIPGAYGGRPAHIHFKVWQDGKSVLTSQIYFAQKGGAQNAALYRNLSERQTVDLQLRADLKYAVRHDIII